MAIPSLMQMMQGKGMQEGMPMDGMQGMQDMMPSAPPPTPSDLGYGEDFSNPIADEPSQRIEGEEPFVLGENSADSMASGVLPEGPETEMDQVERDDMLDMLQQRAKARSTRSDYFQQQARTLAAKHF